VTPPQGHPVLTDELLAAALGPDPKPDLSARSPRFFRRPLFEALTRAHPASPYLLHLPLLALALWQARALPLATHLALLAAGALAWTFVEYWLHRGFFHMRGDTPARRVTSYIVHRHHHAAPTDPDRVAATPLYSLGLLALLFLPYSLAGAHARWALLAGTVLGYLAYELLHWRLHHVTPRTGLARALRRHHQRHHHGDGRSNFGISSPLWDLVFRTYRG
jgi:sterol desaturase/sphingolipid hydroxylase (fatty acid hydroxylase superfamily)